MIAELLDQDAPGGRIIAARARAWPARGAVAGGEWPSHRVDAGAPAAGWPRSAAPEDAPAAGLEAALADPAWTAEMWPTGCRAWLAVDGTAVRLEAADGERAGLRPGTARLQERLAEAASSGAFASLGEARLDVMVVGTEDLRIDPVDVVRLDGASLAGLPYAVRAVALADALERLREASASRTAAWIRPSRPPATGAAKRRLVGDPAPLRLVLRDLAAPYGAPGAILRVPSAVAGFFDDPWREVLDPT